jgi:hypothetical protein
LIGKNLKCRIVAYAIGIVGIFVAGDDLIDALTKQGQSGMTNPFLVTKIRKALRQIAS